MKVACCWLLVHYAVLYGQTNAPTQSVNWLDLSGKTDEAIVKILEQEVARLAESAANEANARVDALLAQEKSARQAFEQKSLLLEGELTAAVAAREAAEKKLADLRTDSTTFASQFELTLRSEQRLRERLGKFPFKAVVLARAAYSGNLEPVKERMIYEASRLAIEQVNGVQIISETLVKNGVVVRDVILSTTEGKADCQPREWKTIENGTQRVLYLYGIYDIYPLAEGAKISGAAAQLSLLTETHFIKSSSDPSITNLQPNMQQEIITMVSTAEQENSNTRENLNLLVQQEMQLLRNSGITTSKADIQNSIEALKRQITRLNQELAPKREAEAVARQKFDAHRNSEQRIEPVTQSDLERNRAEAEVKASLMGECVTQFRTIVKSLYSQEKSAVENFMLVENSKESVIKQVRLQDAKILGVYLSEGGGDIKYTASVAFRFGFDYASAVPEARSEMVQIPAGSFVMGSNDGYENEKPTHRVYVNAFYLDKYEVTVAQFKMFVDARGYKTDAEKAGSSSIWNGKEWKDVAGIHWLHDAEGKLIGRERMNLPVIHVSWNDAVAYAKWAGKRLPTEAEWEYAARGGAKNYNYGWGNSAPSGKKGANIADESSSQKLNSSKTWKDFNDGYVYPSPVGSFAPSEFGLYDMTGNVWEWCSDWYDRNYYASSPKTNPIGPASGQTRVLRGGAWGSEPTDVRCARRAAYEASKRTNLFGFRCALDIR